jgi:hypothetical protein
VVLAKLFSKIFPKLNILILKQQVRMMPELELKKTQVLSKLVEMLIMEEILQK